MNEFNVLGEHLVRTALDDRAERVRRTRLPRPGRRRTTRRTLAAGLHGLADRLDV